jgi:hypothetical protein
VGGTFQRLLRGQAIGYEDFRSVKVEFHGSLP